MNGQAEGLRREKMPGRELGHRGSDHARLRFDGVRVGPERPRRREGRRVRGRDGARSKSAASASRPGAVGVHRACFDACLDFARKRRQFGKRIGDFQILQGVLADMHVRSRPRGSSCSRRRVSPTCGRPNAREVSVAKYAAVENAVCAANEAVLFLGSRGYTNESPVERHLRDIKGMQIYEGTSHIQRVIIARDLLGGRPRERRRDAQDQPYWNPKNETLPREDLQRAAAREAPAPRRVRAGEERLPPAAVRGGEVRSREAQDAATTSGASPS